MGANYGRFLRLSIFGESHGAAIGMVVDGLPPNIKIDLADLQFDLSRRAPGNDKTATSRKEPDEICIVSGVLDGKTTGAPICGIIENKNVRSQDYQNIETLARPGHADYTGSVRFQGANDVRGGGHFSGRLTAPLVFAGSLARQWLNTLGVHVGAHILSISQVEDFAFDPCKVHESQLKDLRKMNFPLLNSHREQSMRTAVEQARLDLDSVGGVIECAAVGVPAGWGSPFFESLESRIAQLLFSVPAVKGVSFGSGFEMAKMRGSQANDAFYVERGQIKTRSNHNGGINGGISNGMPITLQAVIKPTPSIAQTQETINNQTLESGEIAINGRHDPCIVLRAIPVIESAMLLGLAESALEMIGQKNGGI